jgi:cytoskeletal protein RodZ
MESDEFDFMAPAYVRGFLKNYSRFLHVDPEPLMEEFDRRFGTGRVDTSEIISLMQRDRSPRAPRPEISTWWLIAGAAALILILLTLIGLAQETDRGSRDGGRTASPSPTTEPTSPAKATASPTQAAAPGGIESFADGIDLVVEAESGDCYLEVTADGKEVYTGTLSILDSQKFTAKKRMVIFFGAPGNVDLIIEGEDLGDPSGPGEGTVTINLPKDYKRLKRQAPDEDGA